MGYGNNQIQLDPQGGLLLASGGNLVVQGCDLLWSPHGGGDIGTSVSASAPNNVFAKTMVQAPTLSATSLVSATNYVAAGAASNRIYLDANAAKGVTGKCVYTENVAHTCQIRSQMADGAGALAIAIDADVNNASINDGHKVASFGWINNADARTELMYVTGGADLLWASDGGGDIGAVAANRPANGYASNAWRAPYIIGDSYIANWTNNIYLRAASLTGHAANPVGVDNNGQNSILGLTAWGRADGADNVVIASTFRSAGTPTNAATMRLHTFGTTSSGNARVERADVRCNGDVYLNGGDNAQRAAHKSLTEETTIAAAASTDTAIQIPADALVYAVSVRVTTVIPTAATFDVGVAGATTRYGNGISVAAGTTDTGTDDAVRYYSAAAAIRITPNASPAAATGKVRVTIHYIEITPPTS